jgi:prephenate dehydrogenase
MGAVDKTSANLHSAVEKADVVVLAIPVDEIRDTLEAIAEDLQPGAVVLDTSPIKAAVTSWAVELLPAERYFVSFTPTLNPAYLLETASGIDAAHEDLFKGGLVLITSPSGTDPDAVKLASDLGLLIGAKSLFPAPVEADGLSASTNLVPRLVSAAMVNAVIDQPGWTEARKVAGRAFSLHTEPVAHLDEYKVFGQAALLNKDNVVRVLDDVTAALNEIREAVAREDSEELSRLLAHARDGREGWLKQRGSGDWDKVVEAPKMPTSGEVMSRFFGFRRKKKEDQ